MDEYTQMTKEELEQFDKVLFSIQRQITDKERELYDSNIFFTPERLEQIKVEAGKLGLTVSAYVRMVIMMEVNRK